MTPAAPAASRDAIGSVVLARWMPEDSMVGGGLCLQLDIELGRPVTMYPVNDDRVVAIEAAPRPDVGAPLPALICDEHHVLLAYIIWEPDPKWDGTYVNVVSPDSPDESIAIITFERPHAHLFGPPNDEAFSGHPLASRGLSPYSVSEITSSSWVDALERMNSVHPSHRPEHFARYRHYVFAFHDSTFECVAHGFRAQVHRGSMRSAIRLMVDALRTGAA